MPGRGPHFVIPCDVSSLGLFAVASIVHALTLNTTFSAQTPVSYRSSPNPFRCRNLPTCWRLFISLRDCINSLRFDMHCSRRSLFPVHPGHSSSARLQWLSSPYQSITRDGSFAYRLVRFTIARCRSQFLRSQRLHRPREIRPDRRRLGSRCR